MDAVMAAELIDSTEVARILGLKRARVNQLAQAEKLPMPVNAHRSNAPRFWRRSAIEKWAERHGYPKRKKSA